MSTKHTPGPWITETTDSGLDGRIEVLDSATEGTVIATLRCRSVRMGIKVNARSDEFAANARLIAAAPELLAALKRAESQLSFRYTANLNRKLMETGLHCDQSLGDDLTAVRAAIAKATA